MKSSGGEAPDAAALIGMPVVRRRDEAQEQLEEIWLYIARDNAAAADPLLGRIDEALFNLAQQPKIGRARPELGEDIRSFVIGRYVIFYREIAGAFC